MWPRVWRPDRIVDTERVYLSALVFGEWEAYPKTWTLAGETLRRMRRGETLSLTGSSTRGLAAKRLRKNQRSTTAKLLTTSWSIFACWIVRTVKTEDGDLASPTPDAESGMPLCFDTPETNPSPFVISLKKPPTSPSWTRIPASVLTPCTIH